jgi:hypothetical protein
MTPDQRHQFMQENSRLNRLWNEANERYRQEYELFEQELSEWQREMNERNNN